jgi:hypothetical protein
VHFLSARQGLLWSNLRRQAAEDGGVDLAGESQCFLGFGNRRFLRLPWVAELPGVICKGYSTVNKGRERLVERQTLLAEFFQTVGFTKRTIVPSEKTLHRLFRSLLAVKDNVAQQRRLGNKFMYSSTQIICSLDKPTLRFSSEQWIMRHGVTSPHV